MIGCGLGDDAEHVASLGFTTMAFDVSPSAVAGARRRFPHSTVEYVTADLLSPPPSWAAAFDLVVEVYTLQVLTGLARRRAFARVAQMVAPGGRLLVIAGARDEHDHPGTMPWPLTRAEIESLCEYGLSRDSIVDFVDHEASGPSAAGERGSPPPKPSIGDTPTHSDRYHHDIQRKNNVQQGER